MAAINCLVLLDPNTAFSGWPSLLNAAAPTSAPCLLDECVCLHAVNVIAEWELKWQLLNGVSSRWACFFLLLFFLSLRARKCQPESGISQKWTHLLKNVQVWGSRRPEAADQTAMMFFIWTKAHSKRKINFFTTHRELKLRPSELASLRADFSPHSSSLCTNDWPISEFADGTTVIAWR